MRAVFSVLAFAVAGAMAAAQDTGAAAADPQLTAIRAQPTAASEGDPLATARNLVQSNQLQEAEHIVRQYLQLNKNSADGHFLLGYILFRKQDAKASLAEYTAGARFRRPSAKDLEAVAGDYVVLHDYIDADRWFSQAVQWDPADWQALYFLGRTKYAENRFDEAAALFRKCLTADPDSVKAEDNLGLALEGLGRNEDAMAAYRKAIDMEAKEPKDEGPYLDLGSILVTLNRDADALPYLQKAASLGSGDYRVHKQLGKAYEHLNQLEKARLALEKCIALAPDNAAAHFMLAQIYRKLGLVEKEQAEVHRVAALNATHSSEQSQQ